MTSDFKSFTLDCRQRVESWLDKQFPEADDPTHLRSAMRYSLFNGGKRVRPILVYAAGQTIDSEIDLALLDPIAAALECLHSYSLVHDDLPAMDNDDLRRGKPTCHIAYNESTAILAGDGLQAQAFEYLTLSKLSAEIQIRLVKYLAWGAGAEGMVLGQSIDLAAVDHRLDLQQLETMHRHKTGALIRAAVAMGAVAAGANPLELEKLDRYASAIGLAFQVQDDILDVTSDTVTLGKQQGADIALNKPTYVSLLGLDQARLKARDLYQQSLAAIESFGDTAIHLRQLAAYIVGREY